MVLSAPAVRKRYIGTAAAAWRIYLGAPSLAEKIICAEMDSIETGEVVTTTGTK